MATRFYAATVVQNKCPSTVITGLFTSWIIIFGAPKKILTDNGRELNNSEMRALGEAFNIKIMTTAAESPWSNGICECLRGPSTKWLFLTEFFFWNSKKSETLTLFFLFWEKNHSPKTSFP
ncbi:unnamed protein product [Meganyctiphanes norvegica]|uniref:Integrase catalytic domain-containing protein n=1 Tax=Meganyctiphanes norvegica TaxID=48144 RepID=A0AAV2R2H9_MEGNR